MEVTSLVSSIGFFLYVWTQFIQACAPYPYTTGDKNRLWFLGEGGGGLKCNITICGVGDWKGHFHMIVPETSKNKGGGGFEFFFCFFFLKINLPPLPKFVLARTHIYVPCKVSWQLFRFFLWSIYSSWCCMHAYELILHSLTFFREISKGEGG